MCIKVEDLKRFNEKEFSNYFKKLKEEISNTNDNFIILYGKVNCGKTTIATKLVDNASYMENIKTLYFSLETSKSTITKMIREDSNYLTIYDRPITIEYIISKFKEKEPKFVVIDYLQLIGFDKSKCLSMNKELELIKEDLKKLAKELNIKIVVTSICR